MLKQQTLLIELQLIEANFNENLWLILCGLKGKYMKVKISFWWENGKVCVNLDLYPMCQI